MRVTHGMMVDQTTFNLQRNQARLDQLSHQLSTGRLFTRPSQDPVGTSKVMRNSNYIDRNDQYQRNINEAEGWLDYTETAIFDANDTLQRVRELAVYGANDTLESEDRQAMAEEVKELYGHLVNLGNSRYQDLYMFGGHQTTEKPYEATQMYDAQWDGKEPQFKDIHVDEDTDSRLKVATKLSEEVNVEFVEHDGEDVEVEVEDNTITIGLSRDGNNYEEIYRAVQNHHEAPELIEVELEGKPMTEVTVDNLEAKGSPFEEIHSDDDCNSFRIASQVYEEIEVEFGENELTVYDEEDVLGDGETEYTIENLEDNPTYEELKDEIEGHDEISRLLKVEFEGDSDTSIEDFGDIDNIPFEERRIIIFEEGEGPVLSEAPEAEGLQNGDYEVDFKRAGAVEGTGNGMQAWIDEDSDLEEVNINISEDPGLEGEDPVEVEVDEEDQKLNININVALEGEHRVKDVEDALRDELDEWDEDWEDDHIELRIPEDGENHSVTPGITSLSTKEATLDINQEYLQNGVDSIFADGNVELDGDPGKSGAVQLEVENVDYDEEEEVTSVTYAYKLHETDKDGNTEEVENTFTLNYGSEGEPVEGEDNGVVDLSGDISLEFTEIADMDPAEAANLQEGDKAVMNITPEQDENDWVLDAKGEFRKDSTNFRVLLDDDNGFNEEGEQLDMDLHMPSINTFDRSPDKGTLYDGKLSFSMQEPPSGRDPLVSFSYDREGVVEYQGDSGDRNQEVSPYQEVTMNLSGDEAFGKNDETFKAVKDVYWALKENDREMLGDEALDKMDESINHMLRRKAEMGARHNRVTNTDETLKDENLHLEEMRSDVWDVDLAEKVTEFEMQESVYRAALATTARAIQPTLVDYLG